ncbi:MAG: hypothetical protein P8165_15135 [Deltaproteobacteria bacterium]
MDCHEPPAKGKASPMGPHRPDVFDNRLAPLKVRTEVYEWQVPKNIPKGTLRVRATLNYRRLPQSVADLVKIGTIPIIEICTAQEEVSVKQH